MLGMKVLVADKFEKIGIDGLKGIGAKVEYQPDLKDAALGEAVRQTGAEVLVVRGTKVPEEVMEGTRLSLIVRAGAGYNTIDVDAASRRGIRVSNCPGKNSQAVAELAFGLMLACDRHIPDNVIELRAGKWNKKRFSQAKGLHGRTLGIIGMGKIGLEMIRRAKAFGMDVIGYSRWMTPAVAAELDIEKAGSLEELAQRSDFVSIHTSLTKDTRGMLRESFFEAMKPGAVFINTSRAETVDQEALEKMLKEGKITAGLDVFEGEPTVGEGAYEGSLRNLSNVYCTHHIGASTEQAQEAVAEETVRIVNEYMTSGIVPNVVNVQRGENATHLLVVRHLDKVGVLAHVLGVLKEEGASVQEMENIVLGGAHAAIAQISVDKEPTSMACAKMKQNADVLDASVHALSR